jgi:preprotein translocase subunit SecE
MNRRYKRHAAREEARAQRTQDKNRAERVDVAKKRKRVSPRQYLREIRQELRKVAWPSRKEVVSYTVVVLVATAVLMTLVFGMDYVFGTLVSQVFGGTQ